MKLTHAAVFIGATTALAVVAPLEAQRWRTLDAQRQLADSTPLTVRVEYVAGHLEMRPAVGRTLYNMSMKYDAERSDPLTRFDAAGHSLTLGLRSRGVTFGKSDSDGGAALHAELSDKVPMDLVLELGAIKGDLQLGGLRLTDFLLKGGAADITVHFDKQNPERLRHMQFEIGAADVKVVHAANSGVEKMTANIGVGALDFDLTDPLTHDVNITATVAMGNFTLRVGSDVGIYVDEKTLLADFDKSDLVKKGDGYYSENFDTAPRKVRLHVKAVLGTFKVIRSAR
jgi:hypothetical protein